MHAPGGALAFEVPLVFCYERTLLVGSPTYSLASPHTWFQGVCDYVAGRISEMDRILDWAEAQIEDIIP